MSEKKLSEAERRRRQKARKERERRRREMLRRRRRKVLLLRAALVLACVLAAVLIAVGIADARRKEGDSAQTSGQTQGQTQGAASQVRHLSFPTLLADADRAPEGTNPLTVEEFNRILEDLYQRGYILVDIHDLAGENEEGNLVMQNLELPEGKIPFVLSQRDVSYSFDKADSGYASRLILDSEGKLTNEYVQADGTTVTGDYDVVTCLETFIAAHPDISWNGARGILGLTGYNGILGYRTSPELALDAAEGNTYADAYGTFDTAEETEACKTVVQALKDAGWSFASYGYNYVSYGSELSMVQADAEQWEANVESIVGETDILIFPWQTDLGSWSSYGTENEKYTYLRGLGFRYFCVENQNPYFVQVGEDYVHQGIHEIDSYQEYTELMD